MTEMFIAASQQIRQCAESDSRLRGAASSRCFIPLRATRTLRVKLSQRAQPNRGRQSCFLPSVRPHSEIEALSKYGRCVGGGTFPLVTVISRCPHTIENKRLSVA